jgi:CHASE2 domain-containing sensor protein
LFPGSTFAQWTGIAATALLILVGLVGLITSYNTLVRLWAHRIIAVLVIVAVALHWFPFMPAATAMLVGLCVAGMIHLKLVSGLARLTRSQSAVSR